MEEDTRASFSSRQRWGCKIHVLPGCLTRRNRVVTCHVHSAACRSTAINLVNPAGNYMAFRLGFSQLGIANGVARGNSGSIRLDTALLRTLGRKILCDNVQMSSSFGYSYKPTHTRNCSSRVSARAEGGSFHLVSTNRSWIRHILIVL